MLGSIAAIELLLSDFPLLFTHPEEGGEDVRVRGGQQDERDEGGDAAVEHGRSDVGQRLGGPLPATLAALAHRQEGGGDVRRVVHAQADGDDDDDGAHHVDRDVPEVHEAHHVYEGHADTEHDQHAGLNVGDEDQRGDQDAGQRGAQIAIQLILYHLTNNECIKRAA